MKAYLFISACVFLLLSGIALFGCGEGNPSRGAAENTPTGDDPSSSAQTVFAAFRKAWNSSDSIALENLYESSVGPQITEDLDKSCVRYGWNFMSLPKLGDPNTTKGESREKAEFPIGDDTVVVEAEKRNEGWVIVSVLPVVKLDLRPIKDVVADFEKAWNASNYQRVYRFLTKAMFERKRSFERLFRKRGWQAQLPTISNPSIDQVDDLTYKSFFYLGDGGELHLKWIVEDGRWGLRTLKVPK